MGTVLHPAGFGEQRGVWCPDRNVGGFAVLVSKGLRKHWGAVVFAAVGTHRKVLPI